MKLTTLEDLFADELKDLYSAENQLLKALPKVAKAANFEELRAAFEEHLEQTREHVQRIEQIAEELNIKPKGKKCGGMEGLIEEGKELMSIDAEPSVMDAGLIGAAQRVEHYEIAAYGTACAHAEQLGYTQVAELLRQTLTEEKETDERLTEIAENRTNVEAASQKDMEGEGAFAGTIQRSGR